MFPFSKDMMFDSDSIVVTSLAVTYLNLRSGSKVQQVHCPSNSSEMPKWYILVLMWCLVQGQGHHAKVKGQRAKIIVWGTCTGNGK